MPDFDLLITGGTLIDGSGGEPRRCDIGIRDGRVASLNPGDDATAGRRIDASGRLVTPGFVDVHTHYDGQATWDKHLAPSSNLGATTVVMGNCGVGFAPCRASDHETLIELMEGVEEIPGTALAEGLPWNWETFPQYLDALDGMPRDIDVAALVPHGPVRVFVMGERGIRREPATAEDIAAMQRIIAEGLAAGGVGLSTSRTLVHRSASGEHVPTYHAATDELKQLGAVLQGERGHVFQLISDWEDPDSEFDILRTISRATGARGTFTLLDLGNKAPDGTPMWRYHLNNIESAQAQGLDIRGQVLSRPVGMLMGHPASMSPFSRRPTFTRLEGLSLADKAAELAKPDVRARVLGEANVNPHIFVQIFEKRYDTMYPLEEPINYLPAPHDSVAARAAAAGRDPQEWLYDYFLGNGGTNLIYIPATNFTANIPSLLRHPYTVAALGDGGAHVGSICDTSANIFLLTKWVKERGEVGLPAAIHMLTRQPAELYSLLDRGLIAEGMLADLNIIDFRTLALRTPHIVADLPAGGRRFVQDAAGLEVTIKAGEVIFQQGAHTGALPGKLLRGNRPDPRTAT
ncbi:MAG: amidohydrolase family protein [Pseudomonadales bacterium]|nr:amidohydrolase family protein [Pseudomonadales bacterium]MCP5185968.1 amidohydrolase family protein [Pseudomonadales bacterium]